MSIFKACDIRGAFETELTVDHAAALGRALAVRERPAGVLVAGDGRLSTPALKNALVGSLVECGIDVTDLGRVPTPVFYFARRRLGIPVGVMVTASHNPKTDNGFKIALGELPISEAQLDEIRRLMESGATCSGASKGVVRSTDLTAEYVAFVKSCCGSDSGEMRIVVDAGNGMLGPLAPGVLADLGYRVDVMFGGVDGRFPNHPPNPAVAANLQSLCERVRSSGADLGAAYDGDGDRVAFVNERGEPVDNDRVIVLYARAALVQRPGSTIVYDQKCSDVVREEIVRAGGLPRMEKSGHTFIKTTFLQTHSAYAGEMSGHHFFSDVGGDDGLIASLRMAEIVRASGKTLSQLVAAIPRYPITPDLRLSVEPGEADVIIASIKQGIRGALEMTELDGVRVQFQDGWGMARPSVTEPAITLRFEGKTREALDRIRSEFVRAAPQLAGRI